MDLLRLSNREILREMRYEREHNHRNWREIFFYRQPLALPHNSLIMEIALDQFQDSCNKSTAIYWTPEPGPRSSQKPGMGLIHSIYGQWFCGHDTDIEFGRFVAKLIAVPTPLGEQGATIPDILKIHKAWCNDVAAMLPTFSSQEVQADDYERAFSSFCFNKEQHMHYKLQPLFRALIVVYDHYASNGKEEPVVHLVRTGDTAGLSAPIKFENVKPVLNTALFPTSDLPAEDTITTTLSSAMCFVLALESREERAFPKNSPRDPTLLDETIGRKELRDELAQKLGYTGPEIQGPSTNWIELAEGEEVAPPATWQAQLARRNAGIDPAPNPWRDCRAKRCGWRPMF